MTRVDSHQHFWRVARGDYGWLTREALPRLYRDFLPTDLKPLIGETGIERTVLVQAAQTVAETEFLLALAREIGFIAGVVGWVDFEAADAQRTIARLAADPKLVGLRPMIQDLPDDRWMLSSKIAPALAAMRENGLAFDALVKPRHLPVLEEFLVRHADMRVVIDHGAKPDIAAGDLKNWAASIRRIAGSTRAFCKFSGLVTEAGSSWSAETLKPFVDVLLDAFGPGRLMWGSDWPVVNEAGDYASWHEAASALTRALSSAEQDAIFGGTATEFYGLKL
jgi:L-fuconolactonase